MPKKPVEVKRVALNTLIAPETRARLLALKWGMKVSQGVVIDQAIQELAAVKVKVEEPANKVQLEAAKMAETILNESDEEAVEPKFKPPPTGFLKRRKE